jgi:DNA-binding MarR family transcriptional regulator
MNDKSAKEDQLTLRLLDVIGRQSDLSQRHLAKHMGVALGLANSYLRRCVRKGLVKVREAPANRYLYYLTPKGFSEKSRLMAVYLSHSFTFYRKAGESCLRSFEMCKRLGWGRVLLCGVSDLAEIASLRAIEMNIEIVGVLDPLVERNELLNRPVWRALNEALTFDAAVLTDLNDASTTYQSLVGSIERERILIPDILGFQTPAAPQRN